MNIVYRRLLPVESNIYREIRLESLRDFPENFGAKYEDTVKIEKLKFEEDIENCKPDSFIVGAFDNNKLIGICAYMIASDFKGHIYQMYVNPIYSKLKVGYNLLQKTLEYALKFNDKIPIVLCVREHNENAYHLYKKCGFIEIGKSKNADGFVDIEMQYIN